MKICTILTFLLSFEINSYAQVDKFPDGIYLELKQLQKQQPAYNVNLKICQKASSDKFWNGGNDFYLESNIDSINKEFIRTKIFAYVKNDSILINCRNFQVGNDYSYVITKGNFLAFKTILLKGKSTSTAIYLGGVGSIIDHEKNKSKERLIYVLSLRTGRAKPLTEEYLEGILKEDQDIYEQFKKEQDKQSDSILLNYIGVLNQSVSPFSKPASK